MSPILYIVIPCYNEEAVLPLTSGMFLKKIKDLAAAGKISDKSRILFVNDGSKDKTWDIIRSLAEADEHYRGVCLSRNRRPSERSAGRPDDRQGPADVTFPSTATARTTSTPWTR